MGLPRCAKGLNTLPVELVHKVLDDLTYIKILRLAVCRESYLNECILSHRGFRASLGHALDLTEVIDLFQLYQDILVAEFAHDALPKYSELYLGVWNNVDVRCHLHTEILNLLRGSTRRLRLLSDYVPGLYSSFRIQWDTLSASSSVTVMRSCWGLFHEAERQFNLRKAQQLNWAADILESYPGMVCLKVPLDPSQGPPRRNVAHIARRFRGDAHDILKNGILVGRFSSQWVFKFNNLPLVPYDRYLTAFLDMVLNHPLPTPSYSVEALLMSQLSIAETKSAAANQILEALARSKLKIAQSKSSAAKEIEQNFYPSDIAADISIVLKGLSHIYQQPFGDTSFQKPQKRIETTSSLSQPTDESDSHLVPGHSPRFLISRRDKEDIKRHGLALHDEREYEWLSAFLRALTWMDRMRNGTSAVAVDAHHDGHARDVIS